MKVLSKVLLLVTILLTSSFSCFAADSETSNIGSTPSEIITLNSNSGQASAVFSTVVVDLNTGVEYRATSGSPVTVDAELGHQYSVSASASISKPDFYAQVDTNFNLGTSGLTINCSFAKGGGVILHTYSFNMPEDTTLSYVANSQYTNDDQHIFVPTIENDYGTYSFSTNIHNRRPLNDGFILEVCDKDAILAETTPKTSTTTDVPILIAAIGIVLSGFAGFKLNDKLHKYKSL